MTLWYGNHWLKIGQKPFISMVEMLRHDAHLIKNRHERGVAIPTGYQMEMQVLPYTGPGSLSLIKAYIDAFTVEMPREDLAALLY